MVPFLWTGVSPSLVNCLYDAEPYNGRALHKEQSFNVLFFIR